MKYLTTKDCLEFKRQISSIKKQYPEAKAQQRMIKKLALKYIKNDHLYFKTTVDWLNIDFNKIDEGDKDELYKLTKQALLAKVSGKTIYEWYDYWRSEEYKKTSKYYKDDLDDIYDFRLKSYDDKKQRQIYKKWNFAPYDEIDYLYQAKFGSYFYDDYCPFCTIGDSSGLAYNQALLAIYNRAMYENKTWQELLPKYVRNLKETKYFKLYDFDKQNAIKQLQETIKNNGLVKGEKVYFATIIDWQNFDFNKIDEGKTKEIRALEKITIDKVVKKYSDHLPFDPDYSYQQPENVIRELTKDEDQNVQTMITNYYLRFNQFLYLNSLPLRLNHQRGVDLKKQYYYLVALYNRCISEDKPWQELLPQYAKAFNEAQEHQKIRRIFDLELLEGGGFRDIDIFYLLGFKTPWLWESEEEK
jgi:hypothetical protein